MFHYPKFLLFFVKMRYYRDWKLLYSQCTVESERLNVVRSWATLQKRWKMPSSFTRINRKSSARHRMLLQWILTCEDVILTYYRNITEPRNQSTIFMKYELFQMTSSSIPEFIKLKVFADMSSIFVSKQK